MLRKKFQQPKKKKNTLHIENYKILRREIFKALYKLRNIAYLRKGRPNIYKVTFLPK